MFHVAGRFLILFLRQDFRSHRTLPRVASIPLEDTCSFALNFPGWIIIDIYSGLFSILIVVLMLNCDPSAK